VLSANSEESIRLVDDGFAQICHIVNDECMRIRAQTAGLLGSLHAVSQRFLDQMLVKMIMSDMRRKKSAHKRSCEQYESGEWLPGKKFGADRPQEHLEVKEVNVVSSGVCGDIMHLHGLEDEFLGVHIVPSAAAHVLWTEPLGRRTYCNGSSTRPHAKAAADARWGKQREETLVCQLPLHAQPPAEASIKQFLDHCTDSFTNALLAQIHCLESCDPAVFQSVLQANLSNHRPAVLHLNSQGINQQFYTHCLQDDFMWKHAMESSKIN